MIIHTYINIFNNYGNMHISKRRKSEVHEEKCKKRKQKRGHNTDMEISKKSAIRKKVRQQ